MVKKFFGLGMIVFMFALVFSGCKASVKGETQKWENNKKELAEALDSCPAFKVVLEKKMADAQKMWDEAAKVSGDDAKATKMKEANTFLDGLLNQFTQIKYKKKGLEDSIDKFNRMKLSSSKDQIRSSAVSDARTAISEVNKMLADAKVTAEEDAKTTTKEAISKLISAQGDIDRAMNKVKPKKRKKHNK